MPAIVSLPYSWLTLLLSGHIAHDSMFVLAAWASMKGNVQQLEFYYQILFVLATFLNMRFPVKLCDLCRC